MSRPGLHPAAVVAFVALSLACVALPVFLAGTLSAAIRSELGLTGTGIGAAIAGFFLAAAIASVPAGRVADRLGSRTALRGGLGLTAVVAAAVGLVADSPMAFGLVLCLGGAAVAVVDTAGARALAASVPIERHGLAFGAKEASIPTAALLAGLAVPLVGERFGWRPAFAAAGAVALAAATLVPAGVERVAVAAGRASAATPLQPPSLDPTTSPSLGEGDRRQPPLVPLVLVAVAAGSGAAAANAAATFLVPGVVATADVAAGSAGFLLAVASIASVLVRLAAGLVADRRAGNHQSLLVALMMVGTVGMAGLASGSAVLLVPAAVLALGGGWGWTGLAFLSAVRLDPHRPARAAGIVLTGLALGGAGGPAAFGAVSTSMGFGRAWTLAAAAMAVGTLAGVAALRSARRTG